MVKNCDLGLENAALGLRPRAVFSRPRSQFFTIRTSQPANNIYLSYGLIQTSKTSKTNICASIFCFSVCHTYVIIILTIPEITALASALCHQSIAFSKGFLQSNTNFSSFIFEAVVTGSIILSVIRYHIQNVVYDHLFLLMPSTSDIYMQ